MLQEHDRKVFGAVKGKWICRLPQEITILILRLLFEVQHKESQSLDVPSLSASLQTDRRTLEAFIEFLKKDRWKTWNKVSRSPPLVPGTFCFDETRARIGTSKPKWPRGHFRDWHPWCKFIKNARDKRVSHPTVQEQFKEAQDLLDTIRNKGPQKPSEEVWNQILLEFQHRYHGALRCYSSRIWQAVDPRLTLKDPCWRDRCYYDVILLKECGEWAPQDTKTSSDRLLGPCAESCLHAEETESRLERGSKDRSVC